MCKKYEFAPRPGPQMGIERRALKWSMDTTGSVAHKQMNHAIEKYKVAGFRDNGKAGRP